MCEAKGARRRSFLWGAELKASGVPLALPESRLMSGPALSEL